MCRRLERTSRQLFTACAEFAQHTAKCKKRGPARIHTQLRIRCQASNCRQSIHPEMAQSEDRLWITFLIRNAGQSRPSTDGALAQNSKARLREATESLASKEP